MSTKINVSLHKQVTNQPCTLRKKKTNPLKPQPGDPKLSENVLLRMYKSYILEELLGKRLYWLLENWEVNS